MKNVIIDIVSLESEMKKLESYVKKLKIGNVELNNNVLLAPMAGITPNRSHK